MKSPGKYVLARAKTGQLKKYKVPKTQAARRALYARLVKANKMFAQLAAARKLLQSSPKPRKARKPQVRKRPIPKDGKCPTGYVVAADSKGRLRCYKVPTDKRLHKRFFAKLHRQNKTRVENILGKYNLSPSRLYAKSKPGTKKRASPKPRTRRTQALRGYIASANPARFQGYLYDGTLAANWAPRSPPVRYIKLKSIRKSRRGPGFIKGRKGSFQINWSEKDLPLRY